MFRKLNRGVELFGRYRVFWFNNKNWRRKPHPYWYYCRYGSGDWTLQCMRFELWRRV